VSPESAVTYEKMRLSVDGVDLSIATVRRGGELAPIVFLHGFGSTKEDYVDIAHTGAPSPGLRSSATTHRDAGTPPARTFEICIAFLVKTAQAVLHRTGLQRFHLVGHSMGGLTRCCWPTRTQVGS
jgi:pimeloyl-ACP methyl ester carboxylesterase